MKKSVTILSLIILAFSSLLVVSCRRIESNKNTNHINNISNNKKNDISNFKEKYGKENNKNSDLNNTTIEKQSLNKNNMQSDRPIEKNDNTDVLSEEKERILELLKDLGNKTGITELAEELITRKEYLLGKQIQDKKWSEYKKKILDLFRRKQYEEIKDELTKLLNESAKIDTNKRTVEDKLKTYKDISINENLKDGILEEFRYFFEKNFNEKRDKETSDTVKNFIEEINKLISQKNTEELKNKLFKLVDEISQLEKTQK
ncbi:lipoprotein [Mycoplasma feriruminatoris]|uniref:hypothetical protein n=1 Tax=Mycoplasma feriruminatoris TaxID=1179777 RepID=UPI00241D0809|nr:hypothetical protein [Mycoplasma feriruminatoris]WFQ96046.1 lipoprotein [Mycoplasma feriruminatoris]